MNGKIDWAPYFGPMLAFALVLAAGDYAPAGSESALLVARVLLPAAVFAYFWKRGSYPELGEYRPGAGVTLDLLVGLAVTALWVAPYVYVESLRPGAEEAFDPDAAGAHLEGLFLALRLIGFVLVTPFIEELLVRSFLIRVADVYDTDRDFRDIPIGTFTWRSFLVTVAWFTFTHAQWEWPVAAATGVVYNLWLYKRKHIGSLILTHAVTNAALFWFATSDEQWMFFL